MNSAWQGGLGLALLGMAAVGGCRITPEEIQRIETENEVLRREIQIIRENCDYYDRELELDVEGEGSSSR